MSLACELAADTGIEEEADVQSREDEGMSLNGFLHRYADLTAEQLEEANKSFRHYGIHDFEVLRHFATEDLINRLQLSEETAKKVQLATMKNTCLLFAELAEMGGIPSVSFEPDGSAESDDVGEHKHPTCDMS